MTLEYTINPKMIEQDSFTQIRALTNLDSFDREQQQVVMRIVHSVGLTEIAGKVRFSDNACLNGLNAISKEASILCDVEMVKQGITKRLIQKKPLCYLNDPRVPQLAKCLGETRTMAALTFWTGQLEGAIVIIGNAPTALFRLLELLKAGAPKPALIIGMPVGFVGAAESKRALWSLHKKLGVECITLLGRQGGSAVSSATINALLRCFHGEWY